MLETIPQLLLLPDVLSKYVYNVDKESTCLISKPGYMTITIWGENCVRKDTVKVSELPGFGGMFESSMKYLKEKYPVGTGVQEWMWWNNLNRVLKW